MRSSTPTPINQRAALTREMACDYLSIGRSTFRTYESSGDIKGFAIGNGREKRFKRTDLDDLIERIAAQDTNIDRAKRGDK
jgi:excisionase family DNA binding protein